jgi:hypothetical protein
VDHASAESSDLRTTYRQHTPLGPGEFRHVFDRRLIDGQRQHAHGGPQEFMPPGIFGVRGEGRLA